MGHGVHGTKAKSKAAKADGKEAGKGAVKSQSRVHGKDAKGTAQGQVSAAGTILAKNVGEDIGTAAGPGGAVLTSDHSLLGVVGAGCR